MEQVIWSPMMILIMRVIHISQTLGCWKILYRQIFILQMRISKTRKDRWLNQDHRVGQVQLWYAGLILKPVLLKCSGSSEQEGPTLFWEVHVCREETTMEEERRKDEEGGAYSRHSKWLHFIKAEGVWWEMARQFSFPFLLLTLHLCIQELHLPSSLFLTQGLTFGCLGPPKAPRSSNSLNYTPWDNKV